MIESVKIKLNTFPPAPLFLLAPVLFAAMFFWFLPLTAYAGVKTATSTVDIGVVGKKDAATDVYYNLTVVNKASTTAQDQIKDCPATSGCFISKIQINRIITCTGGSACGVGNNLTQIANTTQSNCTTPSLATFTRHSI